MAPSENDLRILVVGGADKIARKAFGALVVDGSGTTRVGKIDVAQGDVPAVLALTAAGINDAVGALASDQADMARIVEDVWGNPKKLPFRQKLFSLGADGHRRQLAAALRKGA